MKEKKKTFYLYFTKDAYHNQFAVTISNREISLTLNQDLERLTTYPSEDFNRRIDNIKGDFKERLMSCLYMMWDFEYAFQILYANQPK